MARASQAVHTVGKRKTAVARIRVAPGTGTIKINNREFEEYFLRPSSREIIMQPLRLTDSVQSLDIRVNVRGSGPAGQAGAVRHAISRALIVINPEFRGVLKSKGLLTRDSRKKERKLYGQRGARARFQFSKR